VERVGLVTSHEQEFVEFAAASAPRLRRAAFLLCGDWPRRRWRRCLSPGARSGATTRSTRTLFNCYLAHKRLRRSTEILTGQLPDGPAVLPAPETRMVVLDALATLPPPSSWAPRCELPAGGRWWLPALGPADGACK